MSDPRAPPSDSASPGPLSSIMIAINSALAIVRNPVAFMMATRETPATVNGIMISYVAIMAAIPFVATLLGDVLFSGLLGGYAFVGAMVAYVLNVAAVYVIAVAIKTLAPSFNSSADQIKTLKLAAYIYTPAFLVSIVNIIPLIGIIGIFGLLYGLGILYLGLPIMLGTPKEKVTTFVVAIVVAIVVVYVVIGGVQGLVSAVFNLNNGLF